MFATVLLASLTASASPSAAGTLSGRVVDSAGAPIPHALVVIEEAHRSTVTASDGRYALRDVPTGIYGVSYRAIGYRPRVIRTRITNGEVRQDAVLAIAVVELPPIQTTATPLATAALESPQPLTVLQGAELRRQQAASLGAVLDGLPGVRSQSTGNGIAKPVIRGLAGNRILVLDNGQRTESQQWGDEHAPNVETASAARIEVVRGPASVLYGSDAMGGVINVVARDLPDATSRSAFVRGRLDGGWSSNGAMSDGDMLLEGAAAGLAFRATASGRISGDIDTPRGVLDNSGLGMASGSLAVGIRNGSGALTTTYSQRRERLELHEDPATDPDATPRQRVLAQRLAVAGNLSLGDSRLEVDLGWETNRRREFASLADDAVGQVELGLRARTLTADMHLHHAASARIAGIIGVQAMHTTVTVSGEETLVPPTRTRTLALYGFEQLDLGRLQFSLGARIDHRNLAHDATPALALAAGSRDWTAASATIGALYRLAAPAAVVINLGRGFRAPSASELFARGVHEGTRRYEVGDAALDTERSWNADLAVRVQGDRVQAEVGVFANRIAGYIYPDPTDAVDPESGLQVYRIIQGDADLRGFEAAGELHATRWLHLRGGADYVWGRNRTTGSPLAFVAPLRLHAAARAEGASFAGGRAPWGEFGVEHVARQRRIDPEDIAPAGYSLVHVGAGVMIGRIEVQLQVDNLLDRTYRGFLSRYKRYADEMGRNLRVSAGVEF